MIKNISFVLIILFTALICFIKPTLHKQVIISENIPVVNYQGEEAQVDWNNWHSRILNRLITDSKAAPNNQPFDTLNYIEFDVDNDKNIVNIKIYTKPQQYSKSAKSHFASIVRDLDGDNTLAFPKNSQRKLAHFKAILKKSNKTKLSTPDDFQDIETIKVK